MNWSIAGSCMQLGANVAAIFTPCHAMTRWGFFQRSAPVGGAANGIPLNAAMPFSAPPSTTPPVTLTVVTCAAAEKHRAHAAAAKLARRSQWFIVLSPRVDWGPLFACGTDGHNAAGKLQRIPPAPLPACGEHAEPCERRAIGEFVALVW